LRILVTSRPVDFRRGMDSLSALVKELLAVEVLSASAPSCREGEASGSRV
jgi:hypothetical protein